MPELSKDIKDMLVNEIRGTFKDPEKRLAVWAETEKFNWKEDESVWKQKRGLDKNSYEVYFDTEFVCFITEADEIQKVKVNFLTAMKNLYAQGKIFVHKEMYDVQQALKDAEYIKKNTVEMPSAHTPEEKMIADVLTKAAKKKGKKVVQK